MDLPNGWSAVRLGEVCRVMDVDHKMPKSQPNGIPFISAKDLVGSSSIDFSETKFISEEDYRRQAKKCAPKKNDVLFTRIGTIGVARLVKDDRRFGISYSLCVVRPSEKVVPEYLEALMNSEVVKKQATMGTQSIAVPDLGLKQIRDFLIQLPPLNAQKRITSIYERATRLKDLRRQANQLTSRIIQSVFLKMFGDPATNPKDWPTTTIGNHANIRYGTGSPPRYEENGIPFVRATNIKMGRIVSREMKFISEESTKRIAKCRLQSGNLILVRSGVNTGDCAYVTDDYDGAYAAYDLILDFDKDLNSRFVWAILNMPHARKIMKSRSIRAAQPHLNAGQVSSIEVPKPPIELQRKFVSWIERIDGLEAKQMRSSQEINQLFNSLMHKAFRGELKRAETRIA